MAIEEGVHEFEPSDGTLAVRTYRTGAVAMAGHDLLLHVGDWHAAIEVVDGAPTSVELDANASSFQVIDGTGGIQALDDGDRANILQTIDDEILEGSVVTFRSSAIEAVGGSFRVHGHLTLMGATHPLDVELAVDGGAVRATAVVKQSSWGMKPYSTLFGALKVADDVEVALEARLAE
jgi:polyisoprenoid-binding protein YceI